MRIPQYNPNQVPGVTRGPRKSYGSPVGAAIQKVGAEVQRAEEAFKQAEQVAEFSERNSSLMQSLNDLEMEFQDNPDSKVADFEERAAQARQSIISEAQDHAVKRMLTESYNRAYPYKISKIKQISREHMIDKDLAALPDRISMYVDMAATATSGKERAHYREQGKVEIQGRVASGIISAKDGVKILKDFDYRVNRESVWEVASSLPYDEALKYLNSAKGLTRQDRNEFERQLEVTHKMEEARLIKEKKELAEKTEKDFLTLYLADDLNYMDILKSPLESGRQEHWIDKLKKQANANKKGKQEDLLTKSTPETLREVYKQIYDETGPKITQEQIIDKVGNEGDNLTPPHADKYLNDLESVLKKSDPLQTGKYKIAMEMIDKAYTEGLIDSISRWAELKEEIENFLQQNPDAPTEKVRETVKTIFDDDVRDYTISRMEVFKSWILGTELEGQVKEPEIIKGKIK